MSQHHSLFPLALHFTLFSTSDVSIQYIHEFPELLNSIHIALLKRTVLNIFLTWVSGAVSYPHSSLCDHFSPVKNWCTQLLDAAVLIVTTGGLVWYTLLGLVQVVLQVRLPLHDDIRIYQEEVT